MYVGALTIKLIIITILWLITMVASYIWGYKNGRTDEGEEWAEKKDYYEWLLEMKKRQDFEEVKFVPENKKKKEKLAKAKFHCDICGKPIKKGALCYECKKNGW